MTMFTGTQLCDPCYQTIKAVENGTLKAVEEGLRRRNGSKTLKGTLVFIES